MSPFVCDKTWPEIKQTIDDNVALLLGQTEQHRSIFSWDAILLCAFGG